MQIRIMAVGKIKDSWIREGIEEYRKRLGPYCRLEIQEIAEEKLPDNPSNAQILQTLEKEGERLLKGVSDDAWMILLDLHGKHLSSEKLAESFDKLALNGQSQIVFVIGGAFGLSNKLRTRAQMALKLSDMTFTHPMTRLILVEQIYRAFKISRGEKYHW